MIYTFNDKIIKYNNKCIGGHTEQIEYYYLTNFNDIVNDIDQPADTKTGYKWNLKYSTNTPVRDLATISSVDGTLPDSFIGKTYRKFTKYKTTGLHWPESGNFSVQFWYKCTNKTLAGGFVGVRSHMSNTNTMIAITEPWSDPSYEFFAKIQNIVYYNGGKFVRDGHCYDLCVSATNWHFYSIEVDRQNNKIYCYSDGIIRLEADLDTLYNDKCGFGTDGSYATEIGIAEFAIHDKLLSSGTGASRIYPVPTEPLINS